MGDEIVSKPDHGEMIIINGENGGTASQRFQLYLDDLTERMNTFLLSEEDSPITGVFNTDYDPNSVLYRPSTGTALANALINEQELLGRITGGEIEGLAFADIWSILDDGIANATINETGGAVDFRVESANSTQMFLVDGSEDRIGISASNVLPRSGVLHIVDSYASGAIVEADADAAELVLEHDFFGGMSILNGANGIGTIAWGSPDWGNLAGQLYFFHDIDFNSVGRPSLSVNVINDVFMTIANDQFDGDTTGVFINPSSDEFIDFQWNSFAEAPFMRLEYNSTDGVGRMGLSQGVSFAPTDGILHIFKTGAAGVITADSTGDHIVMEGTTEVGMSFLFNASEQARIWFGIGTDATRALFEYNDFANNGWQWFWDNVTVEGMRLNDAVGLIINPGQETALDFRAAALNSTHALFMDSSTSRVGISDLVAQVPTDGLLHLTQTGMASAAAASGANTIVCENSAGAGMSFLSAPTSFSTIAFGDSTNGSTDGTIEWDHASRRFDFDVGPKDIVFRITDTVLLSRAHNVSFIPNDTGAFALELGTAGFAENCDIDFHTSVTFVDYNAQIRGSGSTGTTGAGFLDIHCARLGLSTAALAGTDGVFHILEVSAGTIAASTNSDELVIEGTGERGIQFLTDNATGFANISYGDPSNGALSGQIRWDTNAATFTFIQATRVNLTIAPLEVVVNDGSLSNMDFRCESDNNPKKLWIDASADVAYTRAGGSTSDTANARIGGYLDVNNTAQASTAIATEETLMSFSLPAFSMGVAGQGVRIKAWGTTAANATAKQIRLKFGATAVFDSGNVAANGETWHFQAEVFRTGGATQDAIGFLSFYDTATPTIVPALITTPAETLTGAVTIAITSQVAVGAAAADVTAEGFTVEYIS